MDGYSHEPRMKRRKIDRDADKEDNEGNNGNSNPNGEIKSVHALRRALNFQSSNRQDLRNGRNLLDTPLKSVLLTSCRYPELQGIPAVN